MSNEANQIPSQTAMAKDLAKKWIEKHASVEYRMTVFFPSFDQGLSVRKTLRFATSDTKGHSKVAKIQNAKIIPGMDSVTVIAPDESQMLQVRAYLEGQGYEVEWGW